MSDETPAPGSPAAIEQGCECPILDNSHVEQAVTEAGAEAAAKLITTWLGFAWDGLPDGRIADKGLPIFTHGQFGWGFQGYKGDMVDLARTALRAAMEAERHA